MHSLALPGAKKVATLGADDLAVVFGAAHAARIDGQQGEAAERGREQLKGEQLRLRIVEIENS